MGSQLIAQEDSRTLNQDAKRAVVRNSHNRPKYRPQSGNRLLRMTILTMIALILSKVTGQLRDILSVNLFGHGYLTDAYTQGFLIPDFVFELLIGGSISAALIPTLSGQLARGQGRSGWRSISIFISYAMVIMLFVAIAGIAFAPILMRSVTNEATHALAVQVTRILFPQTYFMMLAALCIGILNAYNRFDKTAFGPVIYNIGVVISLIVFGAANENAVLRVTAGVTASAFLYFLLQASLSKNLLRNFRFSLDRHNKGFRRLLKVALPTLLSASIPQLNNIILNIIISSSGFPSGTATSLRNANTLWMLPWGVFAVAIGNIMLPNLSAEFAARRFKESRLLLSRSLRNALFITIPCALIFFVLREDLVRAVFQWSADSYTQPAVELTAGILSFYCLTIITHTIVFILNNAFFSMRLTIIPLLSSILSLIMTSGLGYFFSNYTPLGPSGLSLGYAAASLINSILLLIVYKAVNPKGFPRKLGVFFSKTTLAALITIAVMLLLETALGSGRFDSASKAIQLAWFAGRSVFAFLIYYVSALLLGIREAYHFMAKLLKRLGIANAG